MNTPSYSLSSNTLNQLQEIVFRELNNHPVAFLKRIASDLNLPASSSMKKKALQQDICQFFLNALTHETLIQEKSFSSPLNLEAPIFQHFTFLRPAMEKYNEFLRKNSSYPSSYPSSLPPPPSPIFLQNLINQSFFRGPNSSASTLLGGGSGGMGGGLVGALGGGGNNQTNTPTLGSHSCFCGSLLLKPPFLRNINQNSVLTCVNEKCKRVLHMECLRFNEREGEKESTSFECPSCVLSKNDPLHEVVSWLCGPIIISHSQQHGQEFLLENGQLRQIYEDPCYGVEIRCLKLEGKYLYEQTWLDSGELYLNGKKLAEFKPLQINSALKKRKDEKIFVRDSLTTVNTIKFNDFKPAFEIKNSVRYDENSIYMAAVFLVHRLKPFELVEKILKSVPEYEIQRKTEESKRKIEQELDSQKMDDCKIDCDSLTISMLDILDRQFMRVPAKTKFCTHLQCFSLENMVRLMETISPRKWKCPICKVKAFDLVVDQYFFGLIKPLWESGQRNISDLVFFREGVYEFRRRTEEEEGGGKKEEGGGKREEEEERPNRRNVVDVIVLDEEEEDVLPPPMPPMVNEDMIGEENEKEGDEKNGVGEKANGLSSQINIEETEEMIATSIPVPSFPIDFLPYCPSPSSLPPPSSPSASQLIPLPSFSSPKFLPPSVLPPPPLPPPTSSLPLPLPLSSPLPPLSSPPPPSSPPPSSPPPPSRIELEKEKGGDNVIVVEQEDDHSSSLHSNHPPPSILNGAFESLEVIFKERESSLKVHKTFLEVKDFSEFLDSEAVDSQNNLSNTMEVENSAENGKTLKPNIRSKLHFLKAFKKQFSDVLTEKWKEKPCSTASNPSVPPPPPSLPTFSVPSALPSFSLPPPSAFPPPTIPPSSLKMGNFPSSLTNLLTNQLNGQMNNQLNVPLSNQLNGQKDFLLESGLLGSMMMGMGGLNGGVFGIPYMKMGMLDGKEGGRGGLGGMGGGMGGGKEGGRGGGLKRASESGGGIRKRLDVKMKGCEEDPICLD